MSTGTYLKPIRLVIVKCSRLAVARKKITVSKKIRRCAIHKIGMRRREVMYLLLLNTVRWSKY